MNTNEQSERPAIKPWEERVKERYPNADPSRWVSETHLGDVEVMMKAEIDELRAALASQQPARILVTEEMHVAAVKVLQRANGLDGLPQRMLDAMFASSPAQPQQGGHWKLVPVVLPDEMAQAMADSLGAIVKAQRVWDDVLAAAPPSPQPPAAQALVPLTYEQAQQIWTDHERAAWGKTLINPVVFARSVIAKFCEVNGIGTAKPDHVDDGIKLVGAAKPAKPEGGA